jgi:hypothetical protein
MVLLFILPPETVLAAATVLAKGSSARPFNRFLRCMVDVFLVGMFIQVFSFDINEESYNIPLPIQTAAF